MAEDKDALIEQLKSELESGKAETAALHARLQSGKTGDIEVVTTKYKCTKGKNKGKSFLFKPGHNLMRLPADLVTLAKDEGKAKVNDDGLIHASEAVKSPILMEALIERGSGMIMEHVPEKAK